MRIAQQGTFRTGWQGSKPEGGYQTSLGAAVRSGTLPDGRIVANDLQLGITGLDGSRSFPVLLKAIQTSSSAY
jgi:hypothetical protein